jgi:amino acid adenylation domain-containing protein
MRTDLGGNPSFRELLGRVQDVVLSAYSHQDLPFEKLVEELQTERDLSRSPLFQVMFVLENEQETRLEFPGVSLNVVEVESKSAKFDLTVELQETSNGINGWFEYNADLFDADTIGRMIGHWEVLLAGVVAQPNQQISLLPILTEAERHQLLVEWNDTDVDYPKDKCIHQLFEEQVERTPDHVAVVFEDQQLTYRELNARANQLAHYLQKLGVGHEVLVGICLERSLELAIAILGILKAGGVCVPLDPTYPEERLAFMREDTQIRILLTIESLLEVTPKYIDHIVCLDTEWASIALEVRITPANTVTSDNLAFVFYTSGSTGKPKGVMITHIACCKNKLHDHATYQLEESDRILLKSSISFAAFLTEFFWPLLSGATVIMAEMGVEQDSFALVKLINKQKITVIGFSPSILQAFLEKNKIKSCKSIRYVFCNSETLPIELKNLFFSSLNANLQCIYGLTETGLATFWDCRPESNHRIIPIGRHTANTKIYILDSSHQPVPVGITGQLYIGGDGLARGYLNCLEITKEKFIPDCFFNQLSKRLFKTGDMARYLPDGNIEFLGRMDNQVKIRGFRVEPEEVEALLSQFSKIRQTIVMAREDIPGTKKLVAYVVPQSEHVPTSSELRRFLKQTLPDYMIPSIFVFLKTLPLTPNGKVDRRSLPIPDKNRPHLESTFVLPRTPLEQNILLIWSQVLKIEKIGIYDNFFDLGGHSLLATQILSRLKQTFNMDIPFKVIFEAQNIADLSEYIQTMNWFYSTPEKLMAVTQAYRKSGEI